MNLSDIAILNIKKADYCGIISGISKSEVTHLMQNIDLTKKGTLQNINFIIIYKNELKSFNDW